MPRRFLVSLLGCALFLAFGCDEAVTPPDPPDPDKLRECSEGGSTPPPSDDGGEEGMDAGAEETMACPSGEVCVAGRCYDACTEDSECGPREICGSSGACEPGDSPRPDAGPPPMDAGPSDPCDTVTCDPGMVCHPISSECVACTEREVAMIGVDGNCGIGATPVCDIANGTCGALNVGQCLPCNFDEQCETLDMSFIGSCVLREVMDWREQVCLQSCDMDTPCPIGLLCSTAGFCEPPLGISCTTWRAARDRTTCFGDEDCNIRSSSGSSIFFTETCEGEVLPAAPDGGDGDGGPGDAGPPTAGTCLQPCGESADCFDAAGGQVCMDTGAGLTFCVP